MINKVSWYRDHSFTVEESLGFKRKVFHKNQLRSLICYLAAKPRLRNQLHRRTRKAEEIIPFDQ